VVSGCSFGVLGGEKRLGEGGVEQEPSIKEGGVLIGTGNKTAKLGNVDKKATGDIIEREGN